MQTEIAAGQALANEAEHALRKIGLAGNHREKLVGGFGDYLVRNRIGAPQWEAKQAAIEEQRIHRHAEAHGRAENAGVLGNVLGFCVREPDLARFPGGAVRRRLKRAIAAMVISTS